MTFNCRESYKRLKKRAKSPMQDCLVGNAALGLGFGRYRVAQFEWGVPVTNARIPDAEIKRRLAEAVNAPSLQKQAELVQSLIDDGARPRVTEILGRLCPALLDQPDRP